MKGENRRKVEGRKRRGKERERIEGQREGERKAKGRQ